MKNVLVIYESKYGFSKKYAIDLARETFSDVVERKNVSTEKLLKAETIIFFGGLYAGKLNGFNFIIKNFDKIKDKNLIIVPVGLTDPNNKENFDHITSTACAKATDEMKNKFKFFCLQGGIDYSVLGFKDKIMMNILNKALSKKGADNLNEDGRLMLETYGKACDFYNKDSIIPIVEYIKGL